MGLPGPPSSFGDQDVRDIPMLFSAPMVRALLAKRKTQTRRLKFTGQPGDLIWVRETWAVSAMWDRHRPTDLLRRGMTVFYDCGGSSANVEVELPGHPPGCMWQAGDWPKESERPDWAGKRRVSLHMPKWASRLTLRVKAVRREPLNWITDEDGKAEGLSWSGPPLNHWGLDGIGWHKHPRFAYEMLWRRLHGDESWEANPDVYVVDFDPMLCNVEDIDHGDQIPG